MRLTLRARADVKAVLEVDGSIAFARTTAERLQKTIDERNEKMKEEMMGAWRAPTGGWGGRG